MIGAALKMHEATLEAQSREYLVEAVTNKVQLFPGKEGRGERRCYVHRKCLLQDWYYYIPSDPLLSLGSRHKIDSQNIVLPFAVGSDRRYDTACELKIGDLI